LYPRLIRVRPTRRPRATALAWNVEQFTVLRRLIELGLRALGGSMMPPGVLLVHDADRGARYVARRIGAGTATLVRHHSIVVDLLPDLAVLAGYALVLFVLCSWSFRCLILSA
jgi:hypothetical protein